jgi:hypothetical protein
MLADFRERTLAMSTLLLPLIGKFNTFFAGWIVHHIVSESDSALRAQGLPTQKFSCGDSFLDVGTSETTAYSSGHEVAIMAYSLRVKVRSKMSQNPVPSASAVFVI